MMDNIKVSVIVPIYNSEQYLPRCLDSLAAQTIDGLEVILVNDGSGSRTTAVIDAYCKKYPDIFKAISLQHKGPGNARNEGMKAAEGEYIAFCDSDDTVPPYMYKELYDEAENSKCQIVAAQNKVILPSGKNAVGQRFVFEDKKQYSGADFLVNCVGVKHSLRIWNKLYKADFIKQFHFPAGEFEYISWTLTVFSYVNSFCYVSKPYYEYRINKHTVSAGHSGIVLLKRIGVIKSAIAASNPEMQELMSYVAAKLFRHYYDTSSKYAHYYMVALTEMRDTLKENRYVMGDKTFIRYNRRYIRSDFSPIPFRVYYDDFGKHKQSVVTKDNILSYRERFLVNMSSAVCLSEKNCDINENKLIKAAYNDGNYFLVGQYFKLKAVIENGGIAVSTIIRANASISKKTLDSVFFSWTDSHNIFPDVYGASAGNKYLKAIMQEFLSILEKGLDSFAMQKAFNKVVLPLAGKTGADTVEFQPNCFVYSPLVFLYNLDTADNISQMAPDRISPSMYRNHRLVSTAALNKLSELQSRWLCDFLPPTEKLLKDAVKEKRQYTVRLIGSHQLTKITSDCENVVADQSIIDISPLTLFAKGLEDYSSKSFENSSVQHDIRKDTEQYISENITDYLMIDFSEAAVMPLLSYNHTVYSGSTDFLKTSFFYKLSDNTKLIAPDNENVWKPLLKVFASKITQYYPPERIIVIRSRIPVYSAKANKLRLLMCNKSVNRTIKSMEDFFISEISPVVIDLAGSYFADAAAYERPGAMTFEKGFFEDCAKKTQLIVSGSKSKLFSKQDDRLWLRRALYYHDSLIQNELNYLLLKPDDFAADYIVVNTSKTFVYENSADILKIKELHYKNVAEVLIRHDFDGNDTLKQALMILKSVADDSFYDNGMDFSLMFRYDFRVLDDVCRKIEQTMVDNLLVPSIIITRTTLPFYFDLIRSFYSFSDLNSIKHALANYNKANAPLEIDVWGSDISYRSVECGARLAVKNYISSNCFVWAFDKPVETEPGIFASNINFCGSKKHRGIMKNSLERKAPSIIANSQSQWIVVDFLDLISEMAEYKGQCFQLYDYIKLSRYFMSVRNDCKSFYLYSSDRREQIKSAMDKLAALLKKKYGGNIILNCVSLRDRYFDFDGKMKKFDISRQQFQQWQNFISEWQEYFVKASDCYVIDIGKYFLSDENYPIGGASICAYEELYYKSVSLYIQMITKQKPAQKNFSALSAVTQAKLTIDPRRAALTSGN